MADCFVLLAAWSAATSASRRAQRQLDELKQHEAAAKLDYMAAVMPQSARLLQMLHSCECSKEEVRELLAEGASPVYEHAHHGPYASALEVVVTKGIAEKPGFGWLIGELVAHGGDAGACLLDSEESLLALALKLGYPATGRLLLEHGASATTPETGGHTLLMLAGFYGVPEMVGPLVRHGAVVDAQQRPLPAASLTAAAQGNVLTWAECIKHGGDVDVRHVITGATAAIVGVLNTAAPHDEWAVLLAAAAWGANFAVADDEGMTPLAHAQGAGLIGAVIFITVIGPLEWLERAALLGDLEAFEAAKANGLVAGIEWVLAGSDINPRCKPLDAAMRAAVLKAGQQARGGHSVGTHQYCDKDDRAIAATVMRVAHRLANTPGNLPAMPTEVWMLVINRTVSPVLEAVEPPGPAELIRRLAAANIGRFAGVLLLNDIDTWAAAKALGEGDRDELQGISATDLAVIGAALRAPTRAYF